MQYFTAKTMRAREVVIDAAGFAAKTMNGQVAEMNGLRRERADRDPSRTEVRPG
jgi:hypothetical protein